MEQVVATGKPNVLDKTGLCLLSLDGGGVRGLSSLYILRHLMNRLSHERPDRGPIKPCEVFDLIGGTSTGGLIAIMLGRLEMSVDDCISTYIKLIRTIFERKSRWPLGLSGNIKSRFDGGKLEDAIKEVVTRHGAKETDLFNDKGERGCRVFVCTTAHETKDIVRLRDYSLPTKDEVPATICQAALATSAATTFFDPVYIGTRKFVDGALGSNNPVDEVEGEAAEIWCPGTGELKPLVKCFISIGTGDPGISPIEDKAFDFLSKTLVKIATETSQTEKKFIARWAKHFDEKRYFRFNVEQGLQGVGLDEYLEQGPIEAATHRYLDHQTQAFRVRDCIQNLKLKESVAVTTISRIINGQNGQVLTRLYQPPRYIAPWICPFQRNPLFVSRASEIAEIDEMLSGERRCERVAIVGLGGVGKTQIALEYVHSLREQQPDCAVFWIPVTSVESMLEAYLEIGQQLQIPDLGEGKAGIRSLVQQRLSQESSGKWLLVFDNADDTSIWTDKPEDTAGSGRQAAYLPRSKHGSILFTTRSHKTAVDLAGRNVVKVKQMNNTLAKNLLGKCLINRSLLNDEPATTDMLQKLTNLPLAIVQAAAFINRNQMTLREYISLLDDTEQSMVDILSQDFEDEGRYEEGKNPIATTWLISFEQIRSCDPLAAEFLSLMACVDSKNIPQLFLQPTQSTMQAADAIGTLKAFSFITKHENGQLLDLHRLVHLATRNWLRMEGTLTAWTIKTVDRLNELFPFPGDENRDLWRLYLPHARYALDSAAEDSTSSAKIHLLYIFGICAVKDGRYDEAEKALAKVTQNRRIWLGTEHPLTLDSETFLVLAYLHQGQWKKAEELGIQVLGTQEKVLGSEHLCTLASTSTLVTIYIRQERWLEAEKLELQAIKGYEKVFGADHPDTWSCKAALASIYHQKGKWNQCRKLYVQIMKGHRRAYGMEHPRTLSSTNNVAYIYTRLKLLRKAEALQAQALETSKKVLGEEHPHTLAATSNLASIYYLRRRFKDAEKLQIQVLKCHQKLFGAEHPDIPPLMVELAGTWNKLGRVSDAIELLEKCTQLERKVWVADYPETLPYVLRHERRLKRWQVYRRMVGGSTST